MPGARTEHLQRHVTSPHMTTVVAQQQHDGKNLPGALVLNLASKFKDAHAHAMASVPLRTLQTMHGISLLHLWLAR